MLLAQVLYLIQFFNVFAIDPFFSLYCHGWISLLTMEWFFLDPEGGWGWSWILLMLHWQTFLINVIKRLFSWRTIEFCVWGSGQFWGWYFLGRRRCGIILQALNGGENAMLLISAIYKFSLLGECFFFFIVWMLINVFYREIKKMWIDFSWNFLPLRHFVLLCFVSLHCTPTEDEVGNMVCMHHPCQAIT